jgi:SAM-dependent methyltransferase
VHQLLEFVLKPLKWSSESEFKINGVNFLCALGDYSQKTNREKIVLLKDRPSVEKFVSEFSQEIPKNILEFGIFQGGSPVLFSLLFDVEKFVGIDVCQPVSGFDEFCQVHPIGHRIRSYYGVSQSDEQKVTQIIQSEFGSTQLDLIIDDASHHYEHSRRAFEIAFPLLRPGGTYVIEDWGWAHWPEFELGENYEERTPLSILVMELIMACASRNDLISEVRIFRSMAFIRKSPNAQLMQGLSLDDLYIKRNIELVGAQHLNLKAITRLIAIRITQRPRRVLARTKRKLLKALGMNK